MNPKKETAIALVIILVANMLLLAFGMINQMPFWIILIVIALISWRFFKN